MDHVDEPRVGTVVSGGQTGVDRAALDAALLLGIPCGGWCPKGRKAEDGPIPDRYPLVEMPSTRDSQRTRRNVRDSDGTLILTSLGRTDSVCACRTARKPHLVVELVGEFARFAAVESICSLVLTNNHRLSRSPETTFEFLPFRKGCAALVASIP